MTIFDWILLGVLLCSLGLGIWRDQAYESLSLLAWVLVFYLALWLAPDMASLMSLGYGSKSERLAVAFLLVFIAAALFVALLAVLMQTKVKKRAAGPAGHSLGWLLGLLRGMVILLALTVVVDMTALRSSTWWRGSNGASALTATLQGIRPVLPQQFASNL